MCFFDFAMLNVLMLFFYRELSLIIGFLFCFFLFSAMGHAKTKP